MLTNPLHARFVEEFFGPARMNGTEAYRRTFGTTGHSAEVGASRLRKRPDVKAEMERRLRAELDAIREQDASAVRAWLKR